MRSSIPLVHRLRLLAAYSRLVLAYNALLSVSGAVALVLVGASGLLDAVTSPVTGTPSAAAFPPPDAARTVVGVAGLLAATVGHWLGVLVASLVHHAELPLYRGGGWGRVELMFASWAASFAVGVLLLLSTRLPCWS